MFPTDDGEKKFGSKFRQRKYNEMHAASKGEGTGDTHGMQAGKDSPTADTKDRDLMGQQEQTAENPRDLVQAHGPAHSVHVHHNAEDNSSEVISHHGDGHMHKSTHKDRKAAHQHAAGLSGIDLGQAGDIEPARDLAPEGGEVESLKGQQGLA